MSASVSRHHSSSASALALCLLFVLDSVVGGSTRGAFYVTAGLEIVSLLALIWCVLDSRLGVLSAPALWVAGLLAIGLLAAVLQLIPLPPSIWRSLPGRSSVAEAFDLAQIGQMSQAVSLAPDRTIYGLLRFLPSVSMFVLAARTSWRGGSALISWTAASLALASVVLALAQTLKPDLGWLFPYGASGYGGLFQNVNHQASFLLMTTPFVAALMGRLKARTDLGDARQAEVVLAICAFVAIAVGVVMSGSVAGYAMGLPVVAASAFLLFEQRPSTALVSVSLLVGVGIVVLGYVVLQSPLLHGLGKTDFGDGPLSRRALYAASFEMIRNTWPVGSGLGSFESAFPQFEDAGAVTKDYVVHAHSDYLEFIAELGLAGALLLLAAIALWGLMTIRVWRARPDEAVRLKRAAAIALGVVLVHCLVDFPVRTEAVASFAGLCAGILTASTTKRQADQSWEGRPAFRHRHLEL